jgi:hypothetical protein
MSAESESAWLAWSRSLDMHLDAARVHEMAAARFERLGETDRAERASEFAAAERAVHAAAVARHPEWTRGADGPAGS